ncbi:hypothetical protein B0H10DRAFT_1950423 [Mycena sp. CBHHK59/15]|nr:hypothetical protein B0H10DRAFT_1950423 [Mycena sp. CBHHK59/15]
MTVVYGRGRGRTWVMMIPGAKEGLSKFRLYDGVGVCASKQDVDGLVGGSHHSDRFLAESAAQKLVPDGKIALTSVVFILIILHLNGKVGMPANRGIPDNAVRAYSSFADCMKLVVGVKGGGRGRGRGKAILRGLGLQHIVVFITAGAVEDVKESEEDPLSRQSDPRRSDQLWWLSAESKLLERSELREKLREESLGSESELISMERVSAKVAPGFGLPMQSCLDMCSVVLEEHLEHVVSVMLARGKVGHGGEKCDLKIGAKSRKPFHF